MKMTTTYKPNSGDKSQRFTDLVLWDDDLSSGNLRTTASGGVMIVMENEDEFGNEYEYKLILEKIDILALQEIIQKGLL